MRTSSITLAVLLLSISAVAADQQVPLKNWPVAFDEVRANVGERLPSNAARRSLRPELETVPTAASHFVAVVPCRVLDTRNSGSPIPANSARTVDVPGSGCGIPAGAAAYSMNFTAMNPLNNGYLTAYPTGSAQPPTATMSYLAGGPAFDNAAIVPAGTLGAIDVFVAAELHLIIDINGYFVEGVVTTVATSDGLWGGGSGAVTLGLSNGGIADAKLAGITAAGKVANSATTATSANTPNAIVARDGQGGFAAGALTLSGKIDQTSVDGLVAKGTLHQGAIPATGAGARLMWYPGKAASRFGSVTGSQWDDASIGNSSTAMGYNTIASGTYSVAMGVTTTATGDGSMALGGLTTASGNMSIAMGLNTIASGAYSTAMGRETTASGHYSTAMGYYASTTDAAGTVRNGTFVWGDISTSTVVRPTASNQFVARAAGGAIFYSNAAMSTGVTLAAGGGSWATVSDRERKDDFRAVDGEEILGKLAALPVTSWRYKDGAPEQRFIGPVAQDFHAVFGLGDDRTIATLDVDGVTLAGMKALEARTVALQQESDGLRAETTTLKAENAYLREHLERLAQSIEQLKSDRRR